MSTFRKSPIPTALLRHPLVVAAVALVCLSGWCMTVPAIASAAESGMAGHHHHGHRGESLAAAPAQGHAEHCADGECCGAFAKEAPRQTEPPRASASWSPIVDASQFDGSRGATESPPGTAGPPDEYSLPLTC
jgi:hypothetical protein